MSRTTLDYYVELNQKKAYIASCSPTPGILYKAPVVLCSSEPPLPLGHIDFKIYLSDDINIKGYPVTSNEVKRVFSAIRQDLNRKKIYQEMLDLDFGKIPFSQTELPEDTILDDPYSLTQVPLVTIGEDIDESPKTDNNSVVYRSRKNPYIKIEVKEEEIEKLIDDYEKKDTFNPIVAIPPTKEEKEHLEQDHFQYDPLDYTGIKKGTPYYKLKENIAQKKTTTVRRAPVIRKPGVPFSDGRKYKTLDKFV